MEAGASTLGRSAELTKFRTSDYCTTPDRTRQMMVLDMVQRWHLDDTSGNFCCDTHRRLIVLYSLLERFFEEKCRKDHRTRQAWQCKECGCMYKLPTRCTFCGDSKDEDEETGESTQSVYASGPPASLALTKQSALQL
eukprot:TRINITY_DN12777_c0_g1_i6.p2 TRINITY_DN12777_c0_g1~~TRINITY_DN12777_c0_g1_i6.p2  ORF type:complete len:138 (-),score=18.07 TRINITY_DN12777_c0_g1_i6:238-651(-)